MEPKNDQKPVAETSEVKELSVADLSEVGGGMKSGIDDDPGGGG